ncbi:putative nonsense-mediated mRNA decay protein [Helianthus anomalus]
MKGALDRTKVVLRHLPHNISQSVLVEQIDARFSGRYNWFCFRSGKNSLKCQSYSRAYIDFKQPEDVIEFAEFFDGHVFVNEKGTQFKTIVEYAPSQRVPKQWSKKDGREGTIDKDPQYLEFLELLAKPVENLPSAEIQLERKEAERAGTAKEAPIVTPLMDFVRQKRAAKGGSRRALLNGKLARRTSGASSSSSTSAALKRGSERRTSTTMYVPRDTGKSRSGKEKSTYVQIQNRDGQQLSEKPAASSSVSGSVVLEGTSDTGKKKILLLKGKEKEIPHMGTGLSPQQNVASSVKLLQNSGGLKPNQQREGGSGRMIRSILVNKQNQSEQQQNQPPNMERRPPTRPSPHSNGLPDDNYDKRSTRNKDRPDRGVWTPLKRSDESLSSSNPQFTQVPLDSAEGAHGEVKNDLSIARSGDSKPIGSGRGGHFSVDNGSYKHGGRRGPSHNVKDADGLTEGKPLKRGVSSGYSSHEKQVWVQKSSSGS